MNNITSGNLSNGSLPSQKQLDKIENNIPKGDKEMNDQKNKMEQIKKDLRIINQITQRLVISH